MPHTTDACEMLLDLTAQELLALPKTAGMVEIDSIWDVDPALRTGAFAANAEWAGIEEAEIELTAQEMDALLSGAILPIK